MCLMTCLPWERAAANGSRWGTSQKLCSNGGRLQQRRAQALAYCQPCKEALSCLLECHLRGRQRQRCEPGHGARLPFPLGTGGAALAAGGCCHALCAAATRPAAVPHFVGLVNQFALSAHRM